MSAGLIFALLMALAVFGWSLERALGRVREAQRRYKVLMAKRQSQVDRIKKAALGTLYLKRERVGLLKTRDELARECEGMDRQIAEASRPENRIFILDERRMPADQTWIVQITAPAGNAGRGVLWSGSRRYLVWAADEATARTKTHRKFPEAQGFTITSAAPRTPRPTGPTPAPAHAGMGSTAV